MDKEKGTSARLETLEKVKRKINDAYHDRDDYPPYKIASFEDRAIYHQYILKLIDELIAYEKGE